MSNSAINTFDFLHKKREHNSILVKNDNTIGYRLYAFSLISLNKITYIDIS